MLTKGVGWGGPVGRELLGKWALEVSLDNRWDLQRWGGQAGGPRGRSTGCGLGVEARAAILASAREAEEVGGVRSGVLAGRGELSEGLLG